VIVSHHLTSQFCRVDLGPTQTLILTSLAQFIMVLLQQVLFQSQFVPLCSLHCLFNCVIIHGCYFPLKCRGGIDKIILLFNRQGRWHPRSWFDPLAFMSLTVELLDSLHDPSQNTLQVLFSMQCYYAAENQWHWISQSSNCFPSPARQV